LKNVMKKNLDTKGEESGLLSMCVSVSGHAQKTVSFSALPLLVM